MKRESASALLQRLSAEGVAPWASCAAASHPADAPHGGPAPARDGTARQAGAAHQAPGPLHEASGRLREGPGPLREAPGPPPATPGQPAPPPTGRPGSPPVGDRGRALTGPPVRPSTGQPVPPLAQPPIGQPAQPPAGCPVQPPALPSVPPSDRSEPAIPEPPLPFVGALVPPSSPGAARRACDALLRVHRLTDGRHGHVSVPVDPRAAHDARVLTAAARALRRAVGRANLLVRIPATPAGMTALSDCLAEGVGVDVTLIFGAERYARVLDAYFTGMERALAAGLSLHGLGCVTSFPVGPLDAAARALLGRPPCGDAGGGPWCAVALAVARQVFRLREERLASPWWRVLRAAGAQPPRLLWTEPECRHIGALVGWNTAVALPAAVLEAAPDDLELRGDTLLNRHAEGARTLAALERRGLRMAELARVLEARELTRLQRTWPAGPDGPAGGD
ncbi:transaldolase family protein [Streptomyces thermolilacinus]|uniref:Transaldolase n=1 Tax=Streptomyces thermolilacinus SPC6 TaxID=1306406 RepID=A0A1D3DN75_9ACTN|nr:transaldolase family protein [Streptomyces thermolilacinus]OEJ93741.1 hypothetical protein J116_003925 [Streptomyces thermolilacinus SPC6]